jgi:3-oxoacyl-[acyl-carrier-protein] synthase III
MSVSGPGAHSPVVGNRDIAETNRPAAPVTYQPCSKLRQLRKLRKTRDAGSLELHQAVSLAEQAVPVFHDFLAEQRAANESTVDWLLEDRSSGLRVDQGSAAVTSEIDATQQERALQRVSHFAESQQFSVVALLLGFRDLINSTILPPPNDVSNAFTWRPRWPQRVTMSACAAVTGWGHYLPATVLTNQQLASGLDTSDDWISTRTGIRERRLISPGETISSMCTVAGRRALERAGLEAADLDLVIGATTTPDQPLNVRQQLGAVNAGAFDLNSACTGFVSAFITAAQFIQAGTCRRVLVVAGDTLSRFVNWKDRSTSILFGDGAGAAVLEADDSEGGMLSAVLGCQGDVNGLLAIKADESVVMPGARAGGNPYIRMQGHEIFRLAVRAMRQAAEQALTRANLSVATIDKVIPHQANLRIMERVREELGLADEKMFVNIERYGNTGAASAAIALSECVETEPVAPGSHLLLVAFGGGLTWAATVFRWADIDAIVARRPHIIASEGSAHRSVGTGRRHSLSIEGDVA